MDKEIKSWIILNITGLLPDKFLNLIDKFEKAENILNSTVSELKKIGGIDEQLAISLCNSIRKIDIEREFTLIEKYKVNVVTLKDDVYPKMLKTIFDPPPVLYYKGEFKDSDLYSIAIVGCRKPSYYGRLLTEKISSDLIKKGLTIVSGMARGIDTIAHKSSLKSKGRTIAILGSGLARIYPPENKNLSEEIAENGIVISEFSMETSPDKYNFPRRNRVISGLSLGTVVIEAGESSGALITADFALEQGREVFAVPGNVISINSKGTNNLIKQGGAKLIENADDILNELVLLLPKHIVNKDNQTELPVEMSSEEMKIYENLSNSPIHIDELTRKCNIPINKINGVLVNMELKGIIKEIPGKNFIKSLK